MAFRKKPQQLSELQEDPSFSFYVGRLVGAAETCSHLMVLSSQPDVRELGFRLGAVVGWFLSDEPLPSTGNEETLVLPPPARKSG
jgi:hypothetical protein